MKKDKQKSELGMRLFMSLSMQQALMGIKLFDVDDELSEQMDKLLVEMIISAADVIFYDPIEA